MLKANVRLLMLLLFLAVIYMGHDQNSLGTAKLRQLKKQIYTIHLNMLPSWNQTHTF